MFQVPMKFFLTGLRAAGTKGVCHRLIQQLICCVLLAVSALSAHAEMKCEVVNVSLTLTAGVISIPQSASPGTTVLTLPAATFQNNCMMYNSSPYPTTGTSVVTLATTTALANGYTDVYQTTIPGLGIRYAFSSPECTPSSPTMSNGSIAVSCPFAGPLGGPYMYKDILVTPSFVVTGQVKSGASALSQSPIITTSLSTLGVSGDWRKSPLYTGAATGTLSVATCSVQTAALAVELPVVSSRGLSSGVGSVAGRQLFNLSFACASGAQISVVITDVVNPMNRSNVLTLAPDSTAKGVGIQILKDQNIPVLFGPDAAGPGVDNQWLIGASPNGLLLLPLTAQYIRTGDVSPGSVRALATFTMSYQ